ncbi:MAG: tripartite tricarboxylate transporter substrate binding protein [Burkholderiales bacterium]|nr:tripartite tricarboxylate transporter substrate binding protein [Burkholderiales bacterium]
MRIARWIAVAGAVFAATAVSAQNFPSKPVRVIVPFSAGGATDIVTRIVGQKLSEAWGQSIVVDNRAGASGNIGGDLAAKATPDGYTLFMTSGSIVTANQHLFKVMPFNPGKDLIAVTNVASGPQALVVNPSFPAKNIKELIALAKAKPKSITFGSAGFGTQTHLAAENFIYTAGIVVVHIPFLGEAPAIIDLIGGQIQFVTPNLAAAIAFVKQGKLRALGVTGKQRSPQLPDVPAIAETLPGFENLGWFGFMVPAGTPKAIIEKINKDTAKVLQSSDVIKRLDDLGMAPAANTPAEFTKAIKEESVRWEKIIRERKLQVN